jgi:hypothetical protein
MRIIIENIIFTLGLILILIAILSRYRWLKLFNLLEIIIYLSLIYYQSEYLNKDFEIIYFCMIDSMPMILINYLAIYICNKFNIEPKFQD